ncbi:MAG TPA: nucleotidyltransferase family protein [Chloroflexota bacterium]|nr:nucleotidyltransferase family protein [Chloroflexota bacterium]
MSAPVEAALSHLAERLPDWIRPGQRPWSALRSLGPAFVRSPAALERLAPPEHVRQRWQCDLRVARATNLVTLDALARALAALRAAGVRPIVFKGAAAVERLYLDIGCRPMDDADVLVHAGDRGAAVAALVGAGFAPVAVDAGRLGPVGATLHAAQAYRRAQGMVAAEIDLHWQPVSDARLRAAFPGCSDHGLWARAQPTTFAGEPAFALSRVDAPLVTAAAQILGHPWSHPLGYLDLHLMLGALGDDQRRELARRARRLGLDRLLYWSLRFTHELFGTEGLEPALKELPVSAAQQRLVELLVRGDWLGLAGFRREMTQRDLFVLVLAGPGGLLRLLRASLAAREPDGRRRAAGLDARSSARTVRWLAEAAILTLVERPGRV